MVTAAVTAPINGIDPDKPVDRKFEYLQLCANDNLVAT